MSVTTTYFDTLPKNFTQVQVASNDQGIETAAFLEATEGLIALLDLLGSAAFKPVQSDMAGNVKKIRDKYVTDTAKYTTLQAIVLDEKADKKKTATEGLLWLKRGLEFCAKALRRSHDQPSEELSDSFTKAYEETLKPFHGMFVRPIFTMAMKACPYRKDFYSKLGSDEARVQAQLDAWLVALEERLAILVRFYKDGQFE
ncbi:hypothetical protein AMAG_05984 [Allomyces macrogynus ATCC 38327]|uniref:Glycolipid transfer protein domain-containing protein n=1 Tax=Allomyces macrogynus (strain ATCC 38327) TaxID=578462 RepID=A0A0L0SDU8_ALLM3|nr:hypothetical protein AMAG_05984 [Allomyces macrogynus ATCC 38327]|eukprot:KNE60604.1 hypothetical protein AMAG_05984 [Allomyces macrogynus ATCC 38327]